MNPAWRFPVALISTVIALSGCSEKPAEKKVTPPATLITITQASAQTLEVTLSTLGALESVIDPKVAAEVPGRVLKIYARSGRAVKKGELLAELDATDAGGQHRVEQAERARLTGLLAQQERVVVRQNELVAKNFISKNAGEDATAQRNALKSQLAAAQARAALSAYGVARTRITSPIDGTVEVQIAAVGDYLKVGDPVVRLISNSRLRANLPFPESIANRLQRGQIVRLSSPLTPGKVIEGQIEDIRPSLLETSRSLEVIARFDNPAGAGELKSGGSVNALVVVERKESAVMVPEQSVVLRPAGKVIYRIIDGLARQQRVETGAKQGGMIELIEGASAGDIIALDGAGFLSDGAAVSIQERNPPATPAAPR